MTPIEFQQDGSPPVALVGFTDEELTRIEALIGGGSPLWKKVRTARLDLDRITRQIPVAMGGRRDYYEATG